MKSLMVILTLAVLLVPLAACEHTVAENDRTKRNWDGTVTHENTTVKQNDLTGSTSVEKEKSRN